jgi:GrpB-like predicted nucleotidyltransferase (UPF0157 family)
MNPRINVVEYDPQWPKIFEQIKLLVWPALENIAVAIEHVGSTSVVGLSAKPVIDIDIVVENREASLKAIETLKRLGYLPLGTMGVPGREAFKRPESSPKQNLYVCLQDSVAFRNHILLREALGKNSDLRSRYARLKIQLAEQFAGDIDAYCEAKTPFILKILRDQGLTESELVEVAGANLTL